MRDGCVFCDYGGPSEILARWDYGWGTDHDAVFIIEPLNPIVPGHVIAVPELHVSNFAEDPAFASLVFQRAAEWASEHYEAANIITSWGAAATQTVMHLHVHAVPRRQDDGLKLPWSRSASASSSRA